MLKGLQTEIQRIVLLALFLLFFGYINDHILLSLLVGGTLYIVWTLFHIAKLYTWLNSGCCGFPPEASGVWGDMGDRLYRMQQRNERAKQSRRDLSDRIRNITSVLADGVLILNTERELEWWNPAAERLLGLTREDRGQCIINLVRDPQFVAYIQAKAQGRPLELISPEDSAKTLLLTAAEFGEGDIILVAQDITRLRQLEQMRQHFVANISHELRTPLTVLSGYTEILLDSTKDMPKGWLKALHQIQQQTNRMNLLANDLVMLSQLESTRTPPPSTPVDIAILLQQIVNDAQIIATNNETIPATTNRLITLECTDNFLLRGEAKELYSAISNLVFNAIKHNPPDTSIQIKAYQTELSQIIAVIDNGRGIGSKHIPRLTERFYRIDQSRSSSTGGTGLGLAIVKHVLMRHGGSLKINSELNRGSTFSCHFPIFQPRP